MQLASDLSKLGQKIAKHVSTCCTTKPETSGLLYYSPESVLPDLNILYKQVRTRRSGQQKGQCKKIDSSQTYQLPGRSFPTTRARATPAGTELATQASASHKEAPELPRLRRESKATYRSDNKQQLRTA